MEEAIPIPPMSCQDDSDNPIFTLCVELGCLLVLSHLFQLILKPFGQPGPIAQMLAGVVLGPSGFSQINYLKHMFFQDSAQEYYGYMAMFSRIIFMFLIGLEMDIPYLWRTLEPATSIAFGGAMVCGIFGATVSSFVYTETQAHGSKLLFAMTLMMLLANTASPIVIRMASELKLALSDIGRLAISSSLINDIVCLLAITITTAWARGKLEVWDRIRGGLFSIALLAVTIIVNRSLAIWLNRRNKNRKQIKNIEVLIIISLVVATSVLIEMMGYNSIITCFLLGMLFPREGKTARTLLQKLTYPVHTFILPIYFGYTGFQADITHVKTLATVGMVILIVVLSLGGKIIGTLVACHYFKIPLNEGVVLALLLNLKGHIDLLVISVATQKHKWSLQTYNMLVVTVVVNTVIVGPAVAFIVRRERKAMGFTHIGLEQQNPESELRLLACVHCPRHVPTIVRLIATLNGTQKVPLAAFMMLLIELTEKTTTNLMYHQLEDDEISDEGEYGGNDVLEVNEAVDTFIMETGIMIRQVKAVSPFATMHEDVCNGAEDIRASIVLLPFHKHQRIDGMMEDGKEGIRSMNQKVLRYAPCTVGILVDRGVGAPPPQVTGSETVCHHVAILFFGGQDDREALAFSSRLAMNPDVNLTVIRFVHSSAKEEYDDAEMDFTSDQDEEVLVTITNQDKENDADDVFMANFYNRYVTTGYVGYLEKYVDNGAETITALSEIGDLYTLFIVGKGGRGLSPLTTGMSDWEECPDLGVVGDLLASSDFAITGSVLIIQQHTRRMKEALHDEFRIL